jgi:hypothetical protein
MAISLARRAALVGGLVFVSTLFASWVFAQSEKDRSKEISAEERSSRIEAFSKTEAKRLSQRIPLTPAETTEVEDPLKDRSAQANGSEKTANVAGRTGGAVILAFSGASICKCSTDDRPYKSCTGCAPGCFLAWDSNPNSCPGSSAECPALATKCGVEKGGWMYSPPGDPRPCDDPNCHVRGSLRSRNCQLTSGGERCRYEYNCCHW